MMRILQVNKLFYPYIGGVERVVYDLAHGMRTIHDMNVIATSNRKTFTFENIEGISVFRVPQIGTYFSMPLAPAFPLYLKRLSGNMDVLHFHFPFPLGDVSYLVAKINKPTVLTWHSDIVRQKMLLSVYKPFLQMFLRRVDKILVTSPNLLDNSDVLRDYKDKCEVIPLGIDVNKLRSNVRVEKVTEIRKKYGNKPIILFVGRLVYYKGVDYLIRAMQGLVDSQLLIIGDGPLRSDLERLAQDLGVRINVDFIGKVSDEDLKNYYAACDLFVLPSVERSEAFGLVQLEAMAFGKPVVSTDLPTGVPFVNKDGETGAVVPPRDSNALHQAMRDVLVSQRQSKILGNNARERVLNNFTKEKMCQAVNEIYESLN